MRAFRRDRGFTLIELLVVVAIIALLISILLPSLARAKEQSKIVKCLSNQRSMMLGALGYASDFNDICWGLQSPAIPGVGAYGFQVYSESLWVGTIPNKLRQDWQQLEPSITQGYFDNAYDFYKVPPRLRPMNKYMAPSITWDCEPFPGVSNNQPRPIPSECPDLFKCPSDSHPYLPWVGEINQLPDSDTPFAAWEFLGNSYTTNWYWPYYYTHSGPNGGPEPGYSGDFLQILGVAPPAQWRPSLGRKLMKNKDGRFASEFILSMEANLDFALEAAKPPGYTSGGPWAPGEGKRLMGWHKQQDKHTAGFLDGSARYQTMDTRYVFGQGWTIWPNKPWTGTWAAYADRAPGN